ncbi:MAG: SAM-dependent methyltransferase, partial [Flavobacteriales bacterium]
MKLVVVPTPIGNLEDITLRALRTLKECDHIFAEDTRETRKLLAHFSIDKPVSSFHLNNEHAIVGKVVDHI